MCVWVGGWVVPTSLASGWVARNCHNCFCVYQKRFSNRKIYYKDILYKAIAVVIANPNGISFSFSYFQKEKSVERWKNWNSMFRKLAPPPTGELFSDAVWPAACLIFIYFDFSISRQQLYYYTDAFPFFLSSFPSVKTPFNSNSKLITLCC